MIWSAIKKYYAIISRKKWFFPVHCDARHEMVKLRKVIWIFWSRNWTHLLYPLFIDFTCTFDSLIQQQMWWILSWYSVPDKIVDIIKDLWHAGMSGMIGTSIQIGSGVEQGCILSLLLFNVVLDYTMRTVTFSPRGIHWNTFAPLNLNYLDGIIVLPHLLKEMRNLLDELSRCVREAGLQINISKTKLKWTQSTATRSFALGRVLIGKAIEEADKFVYLVSVITYHQRKSGRGHA